MESYPPQFDQRSYYVNTQASMASRITSVMRLVYLNMTLGLAVTAIISLLCSGSMAYMEFIAYNSWFMWALIIAELGIVIGVSAGINKLSTPVALLLFYVFAVINGLFLTPIFWAYSPGSIVKTFFITAGTFAAMSVYGYCTRADLTRFGNILIMALFGLIIASIVNIFLKSDGLSWIISIFGVLIFVGLTAWDTQQMKKLAAVAPDDSLGRLAVLGALNLYLDFINLFLYLLRFFGNRN